jgi:hypothetical protein
VKYNIVALGLIAILTSSQASLAQDSSASHSGNSANPSDVNPAAAAIKSKIEAWGYGTVKDLSRDPTGGWHAHVIRNNIEIAVSVDKGGRITAQPANQNLAARCSQLYGIASRYVSGGAGAEGSLGSNLTVVGADLDCQRGRYSEGIKTLEKILRGQHISYPSD